MLRMKQGIQECPQDPQNSLTLPPPSGPPCPTPQGLGSGTDLNAPHESRVPLLLQYGSTAVQQYSLIAVWQCGSVEYGNVTVWQYGNVTVWQYGSPVIWQYGAVAIWPHDHIGHESSSALKACMQLYYCRASRTVPEVNRHMSGTRIRLSSLFWWGFVRWRRCSPMLHLQRILL